MRKQLICIALMVPMIIGAVFRGAAFSRPVVSPVAPAPMMIAGSTERTDLDTYTLNPDGTMETLPIGIASWQPTVPGFNIVGSFTNNSNKKILFVLNSNTGEAASFIVNNDGSMSLPQWGTNGNPLTELRCTGADIYRSRTALKLVTQDSLTGRIRFISLNQDGSPNLAGISEFTVTDMQDKNLFQIYYTTAFGLLMIGVDTWTGKAAVYDLNMQKVADKDWTRGWTSMDHLSLNADTYRLLYKAAGDPYKKPVETTDQIGRVLIQTVDVNGGDHDLQDTQIDSDYTSARFIEIPNIEGGASKYGVVFFSRTTRQYAIYEFDPQKGLGKIIDQNTLVVPAGYLRPPYGDLLTGVVNGKAFLAFLSADYERPISFTEANAMAQTIYDWLSTDTVGYQYIFAQSGRLLHRRAWGKFKITSDGSGDIGMTTHTQMEIASVSKMITAASILKLAENGQISVYDPITDHMDFNIAFLNSWANKTPIYRLFTQSTGFTGKTGTDKCTDSPKNSTIDCTSFFTSTQDPSLCTTDANGNVNCAYYYTNVNIQAARKIIEHELGISTSEEITQATHNLWANDVDLQNMTCQMNPNATYYGPDPAMQKGSILYQGQYWLQKQQTNINNDNWLSLCSNANWYASSRQLMAFMNGIRYRKIIKDKDLLNLFLSTNLEDSSKVPGSTAFGWEPPVSSNNGTVLAKSGGLDWNIKTTTIASARAYIARLPYNCDAVLQYNSGYEAMKMARKQVPDAFDAAVK